MQASLPYIIQPVWLFVRVRRAIRSHLFRGAKKRVLMVCHNPVAAEHLVPIVDLLRTRDDIALFVTNDHFPAQEISAANIRVRIDARYCHTLASLVIDWDLVIYVNHAWGFGAWLAPIARKVYVNHGLYMGKINNNLGEDGVYGQHRTMRPHRGRLYDRMFAASAAEREAAIDADPELATIVTVTGSLMADKVLAASRQRRDIRATLRSQGTRRIIHVISTWGAASLIATMGESLRQALVDCGQITNVLLSVHPRLDKFGGVEKSRTEILRDWSASGARVDEPNEQWIQFAAASDVAISDHSSLSLYHCMLGHPIIFAPIAQSQYVTDSPLHWLLERGARLSSPNAVASVLRSALAAGQMWSVADVQQLTAFPGHAAERYLQEIDRMLDA